jgi:acyl-CoA reductase-like NAD-dependent aldehyde dehydrogenase
MYIGGKFPRGESGHYYQPVVGKKSLGNICLGSRKDLRDAVVAARAGLASWAGMTAYNRSQVMYRIAEMLEGRAEQFVAELKLMGLNEARARAEVEASVDRLVYFAGWCDKLQQVFGGVNPVAGSYFNFSMYEPQGVVVVVAPEESPLLGLVSGICYAVTGGNACVVIASESKPLCAITLAEVIHSSDVPAGTVNLLTGKLPDMLSHIASHKDIQSVLYCRNNKDELTALESGSVANLKRIIHAHYNNWHDKEAETPYHLLDTLEVKTTWHPIESIGSAGGGY